MDTKFKIKTIKKSIALALVIFLNGCATNVHFPVSSIAAAANNYAKKSTDNQKNVTLEITVQNLASADRLQPPGNIYSIWIKTKEYCIKIVGQLIVKKTTFKPATPFNFNEIFITVENKVDLQYPRGMKIAN